MLTLEEIERLMTPQQRINARKAAFRLAQRLASGGASEHKRLTTDAVGSRETNSMRRKWTETKGFQLLPIDHRTSADIEDDFKALAKQVGRENGIPARADVELKRLALASEADPEPPSNSVQHLGWAQRESRRRAERRKWAAQLD